MTETNYRELFFEDDDSYGTDVRVSTADYQELGIDICESDELGYVTMTFPAHWQ